MPVQAYHGGGSLKAGRSELGYSQAASVAKDSFLEDDALLKDDDPSALPALSLSISSTLEPCLPVATAWPYSGANTVDHPLKQVIMACVRVCSWAKL